MERDLSNEPTITDADLPPVKLATFADYADAQAAVDRLSDRGFPVSTVSIVWSGLRQIERVTGRRTVLTAAAEGAIGGAWFGTLIGLLLALLVDLPEGSSVAGVAFTYLLVGAAAGAVWLAIGHALQRGRRDFSMVPSLDAERYELWVHPQTAGLATDLLGLHTHRPQDAGPPMDAADDPVNPTAPSTS